MKEDAYMDNNHLNQYFENCINDAYVSESRPIDSKRTVYWYIIIENQILFHIKTPYQRVTSKATRRINNNIEKNFGLITNGNYFIDTVLQPLFVCNHFTVGKQHYFLCKKDKTGNEAIERRNQLLKAYYDCTDDDLEKDSNNKYAIPNLNWSDYKKLYIKAYGTSPEIGCIIRTA